MAERLTLIATLYDAGAGEQRGHHVVDVPVRRVDEANAVEWDDVDQHCAEHLLEECRDCGELAAAHPIAFEIGGKRFVYCEAHVSRACGCSLERFKP